MKQCKEINVIMMKKKNLFYIHTQTHTKEFNFNVEQKI
jgi:hypothetical protein